MRIAINAISATAGGARTYLLNLARVLPALDRHEYRLYVPDGAKSELASLPANFEIVCRPWAERNYAMRLLWEQSRLSREARDWRADVLICLGNFSPLRSSVPVLLLSRNSLYFTPRFFSDLVERRHYGRALEYLLLRRLALWSARAARLTITPTSAMAGLVRSAAGSRLPSLRTIWHGFEPWPGTNGRPSASPSFPPFRFLLVSHYNYYRNFETVFRAIATLAKVCGGGRAQLVLTTHLRPGLRLGGYDTTQASRLIENLGICDAVKAIGPVPYDDLPQVYRSAHAVICPAYAESFSHTVVEAMALGLPVIASDIPAHREVAADAALFFSPFDPTDLAGQCRRIMEDKPLRERLLRAGKQRARCFSWRRHFEELLAAAAHVAGGARNELLRNSQ